MAGPRATGVSKSGGKRLPRSRRFRGPSRWTHSTWVLFGLPFGRVRTCVAPKRCPLGPKWVQLGPQRVLRAETEKWSYLGLDGPNRESVDTFPHASPHFRWFPPLSLSLRLGRIRLPRMRLPACTNTRTQARTCAGRGWVSPLRMAQYAPLQAVVAHRVPV